MLTIPSGIRRVWLTTLSRGDGVAIPRFSPPLFRDVADGGVVGARDADFLQRLAQSLDALEVQLPLQPLFRQTL